MIEINLIPDVKKELIRANKTRNFVVTVSIFVGLAAVALVVVLGLTIGAQAITSKTQNDAISSESGKLNEVEDLSKMLTIQNQLGTIPSLSDARPITSRVLGLLDVVHSSGPGEVEISNLDLNIESQTLTIDGQTRAGYPGVEAIIKTLNNAEVSYTVRPEQAADSDDQSNSGDEINTDESQSTENLSTNLLSEDATSGEVFYGRDSDGVDMAKFQLTLVLSSEFLEAKHENVRVVIKNGGNVTDSYLGIPKSIFAEPVSDVKKQEGR